MAKAASVRRIIKSVALIINYKTFIVTTLSVVSTYACFYYDFKADLPMTIVGIAIVFPVVFSIDSAYKRRERALNFLADLKAHSVSLVLAFKDWMPEVDKKYSKPVRKNLVKLYAAMQDTFIEHNVHNNEENHFERTVYPIIAELSSCLQGYRDEGLQAGEMSRVNQYLSKIVVDIENLRTILEYRTPVSLRAYSKVFIFSFPILYAPYFVYHAQEFTEGLQYFTPIIFSFILVSLNNIQDHLENPFDQVGEDDIHFRFEEFKKMLKWTSGKKDFEKIEMELQDQ